jgi:FkbM family methyltransferase
MSAIENSNHAEGDVDKAVLARFFSVPATQRRVFVDVGAARPDYLSMSAAFRACGWRVICIEPNPAFAELHAKLGHEVYQYACSTEDRDDVEFSVVDSHRAQYQGGAVSYESFSSLSVKPAYAALKGDLDTRKITVNMRRLDTILREHAPDVAAIDVLAADVEGWELEVLGGLDVARYRPKVMILENFLRDRAYVRRLGELGYALWRRSFPNDIYVLPELLDRTGDRLLARLNGWRYGV